MADAETSRVHDPISLLGAVLIGAVLLGGFHLPQPVRKAGKC
jgi:hypothetical protein